MKLSPMNKTFIPKKDAIERKWWVVNAEDVVLGRLATRVAEVLRGKNKPSFTPFFDNGDFVVVVNADKVKLTGKKDSQKVYYRHSGYLGSLKKISYQKMLESHPERVIFHAVRGMLPKNRLNRKVLKKLKVYAGSEHKHTAQKPEPLEV